jgi:hypothetical protein
LLFEHLGRGVVVDFSDYQSKWSHADVSAPVGVGVQTVQFENIHIDGIAETDGYTDNNVVHFYVDQIGELTVTPNSDGLPITFGFESGPIIG